MLAQQAILAEPFGYITLVITVVQRGALRSGYRLLALRPSYGKTASIRKNQQGRGVIWPQVLHSKRELQGR